MEKDVVLCKDCMYNGIELCPMKSDWQNRPEGFCDVGDRKPAYEIGDLFADFDTSSDYYILIYDVIEDPSGETKYKCIDTRQQKAYCLSRDDFIGRIKLGHLHFEGILQEIKRTIDEVTKHGFTR